MTTTTFFRRVVVFSVLSTLALGAIALTGFWHPNAPAEAMQMYLPKITLPAVIVAGAIDGINPCAFTVQFLGLKNGPGMYWHNNFGRPMSQGCVNLTVADAEWLYRCASIGTLVRVVP